jgi:hypothetical protein
MNVQHCRARNQQMPTQSANRHGGRTPQAITAHINYYSCGAALQLRCHCLLCLQVCQRYFASRRGCRISQGTTAHC